MNDEKEKSKFVMFVLPDSVDDFVDEVCKKTGMTRNEVIVAALKNLRVPLQSNKKEDRF